MFSLRNANIVVKITVNMMNEKSDVLMHIARYSSLVKSASEFLRFSSSFVPFLYFIFERKNFDFFLRFSVLENVNGTLNFINPS